MVLYWWVASFAHLLLLPIICLVLDRLLPTPHPSLPPFSQEECQELLTLLRSFSREYPYCNRWLLDIHLAPRRVCADRVNYSHTCRIQSASSHRYVLARTQVT